MVSPSTSCSICGIAGDFWSQSVTSSSHRLISQATLLLTVSTYRADVSRYLSRLSMFGSPLKICPPERSKRFWTTSSVAQTPSPHSRLLLGLLLHSPTPVREHSIALARSPGTSEFCHHRARRAVPLKALILSPSPTRYCKGPIGPAPRSFRHATFTRRTPQRHERGRLPRFANSTNLHGASSTGSNSRSILWNISHRACEAWPLVTRRRRRSRHTSIDGTPSSSS